MPSSFKDRIRAFARGHHALLVMPEGPTPSPVMFVEAAPEIGTTSPFNGPRQCVLRSVLSDFGVPADRLYFTYLMKTVGAADVDAWLPLLMDEIREVKPNAVVLLGIPAATSVLGLPENEVLLGLNVTRYGIRSIPKTAFFTTFDTITVNQQIKTSSVVYPDFVGLLRAVFNTDSTHFTGLRLIER